jgi:hypothetical protein
MVASWPARCVEGSDGELAAREGAPLVAIHRGESHGQTRDKQRCAGRMICSRILRAWREMDERGGKEILARAPDADELDLR